jgi:ABC-2 type transport system ATP-binding protein
MIEAHTLIKDFDSFRAVRGVSFTVKPGEVLAVLGPNGAGKTTTVRMLHAILKPTDGWAKVAGFDVVRQPDDVRRSVGVLTEHHGLYFRMKSEEYLDFFGELYNLPKTLRRERAAELIDYFGMREATGKRLGEYSKGMRQKLALIRAMLHDPPVLLLDEPTSAMDPHSAKLVRDAIMRLRSDKRAIILTTHNLTEAEQLADNIAIIRRGEIIARGTPTQLKIDLLGPALMEVRAAQHLNGVAHQLADLVELAETGADWLRFRTARPAHDNPRVLQRLAENQVPVVSLAEVPRSLEDVYLQVVESTT